MVSKGQFLGLDWNRIARLHSQVSSRRVVGSIPTWGSEFFPSFFLSTFTFNILFL